MDLKLLPATSARRCVICHTCPHLVLHLSVRSQILFPLLHNSTNWNSPNVCSTSKLSRLFFFFKVKCYIYCSIYVFCNQLTPGKLCFQVFFPYLSFCVSMMKFLSVAPLIPLLPKPCAFYGEILRSEGIFRFNRNDLWGL